MLLAHVTIIRISALIFLILNFAAFAATPLPPLETVIEMWEEQVRMAEGRRERVYATIDSLSANYRKMSQEGSADSLRGRAAYDLAEAYNGFNNDSAIHYFECSCALMRAAGDKSRAQLSRMRRAAILPVRNRLAEGFDEAERIMADEPATRLSDRIGVMMSAIVLYERVALYSRSESCRQTARRRRIECVDTLLRIIPSESPLQNFLIGLNFQLAGKKRISRASFAAAIDSCSPDMMLYPLICVAIADDFASDGNYEEALRYTLSASMAQMAAGTPHYETDIRIANCFYETGEVERAFNLLTATMRSAAESGADLTALAASGTYARISHDFAAASRRRLLTVSAVAMLLLIALAIVGTLLVRHRREAGRLPTALSEPELPSCPPESEPVAPQVDMARFMEISSRLLMRFEQFLQMSHRKLSAGQSADLYEIVKSGRPLSEQREIFCEAFDRAFTTAFPTFIDDVGRLMHPDRRLAPPSEEGRLTTEARILAMMRLGITDGTEIANLLGVSVNTVYTYRNRLRSRALSRTTFERDILSL